MQNLSDSVLIGLASKMKGNLKPAVLKIAENVLQGLSISTSREAN